MDLQVLISLSELESIFSETLRQELSLNLSQFNAMQLDILSQKHCRAVSTSVAVDVCYYHCEDKPAFNHLSMQASAAEKSFEADFGTFLTRFLFWDQERSDDFLKRLRNVLTNVFMARLEAATGKNIYDNRQYKLRRFELPPEWSTSSDRVLLVTFEGTQVLSGGFSMAL
jgi:hypothetical protein